MKSRLLALAVAVLIAAVATTSIYLYVTGLEEESLKGLQTKSVLVTTRALPAGMSGNEIIETGAFESKKVPAKYALPGAFTSPEDIAGLTLADDVAAEEQITSQRFRATQQDAFFADFPKGTEALSLPLEYIRGVAGHIEVGDKLNAYLSADALVGLFKEGPQFTNLLKQAKNPDDVLKGTRRLLQTIEVPPGVKVFSFGTEGITIQVLEAVPVMEVHEAPASTSTQAATAAAGDFTIAVKPEQAAYLIFGQEKAKLWFTLVPEEEAQ
jgi:Flp pilus assembly protein CpaB